jgi:hypothetical protein
MKILDVCDRCGTVLATIEMDGPPYVIDQWLSQTRSDLGICPKFCGGNVRRVKEDQLSGRGAKRALKPASSKQSWLSKLLGR